MTIPHGDSRGSQSERRKVTFASDSACAEAVASSTIQAEEQSPITTDTTAATASSCSSSSSRSTSNSSTSSGHPAALSFADQGQDHSSYFTGNNLHNDQQETCLDSQLATGMGTIVMVTGGDARMEGKSNVAFTSSDDHDRSALPLLNVQREQEMTSSQERSVNIFLNAMYINRRSQGGANARYFFFQVYV